VKIHTYEAHSNPELIAEQSNSSIVGIEFKHVSASHTSEGSVCCCRDSRELQQQKKKEEVCNGNTTTTTPTTSDRECRNCDNCDGCGDQSMYHVSFSIPVHIRYHKAENCPSSTSNTVGSSSSNGSTANGYTHVVVQPPMIFIRKSAFSGRRTQSSDQPQAASEVDAGAMNCAASSAAAGARASARATTISRVYDITYLGNPGNAQQELQEYLAASNTSNNANSGNGMESSTRNHQSVGDRYMFVPHAYNNCQQVGSYKKNESCFLSAENDMNITLRVPVGSACHHGFVQTVTTSMFITTTLLIIFVLIYMRSH
jgi:hypothetical protein